MEHLTINFALESSLLLTGIVTERYQQLNAH